MSFYTSIAPFYDSIFPLSEEQLWFFQFHCPLSSNSDVLEVGSATGNLTLALSGVGYTTEGLELDQAMIQIAQEKGKLDKVCFTHGNMLHLNKLFNEAQYQSIICFGNTLVHLSSENEIISFLEQSLQLLTVDGKLLIQIINYDRIINQAIKTLPVIENSDIRFERNYHLNSSSSLVFNSTLFVKEKNQTINNSQVLFPIQKNHLINLASSVGLNFIGCYGSFKNDDWTEDGMQSVFIFSK